MDYLSELLNLDLLVFRHLLIVINNFFVNAFISLLVGLVDFVLQGENTALGLVAYSEDGEVLGSVVLLLLILSLSDKVDISVKLDLVLALVDRNLEFHVASVEVHLLVLLLNLCHGLLLLVDFSHK